VSEVTTTPRVLVPWANIDGNVDSGACASGSRRWTAANATLSIGLSTGVSTRGVLTASASTGSVAARAVAARAVAARAVAARAVAARAITTRAVAARAITTRAVAADPRGFGGKACPLIVAKVEALPGLWTLPVVLTPDATNPSMC
jgi:hypothetical protein